MPAINGEVVRDSRWIVRVAGVGPVWGFRGVAGPDNRVLVVPGRCSVIRPAALSGQKCYEVMAGLEDSGLTLDCAGGCACMRYARVGMVPAQMDVMMWCASGARKLLKVQPMVVVGSRRLRAAGGVPVRRCGGGIFNWSLSLGSRPRKFRWAVDGTGGRGAALLGTGLGNSLHR